MTNKSAILLHKHGARLHDDTFNSSDDNPPIGAKMAIVVMVI